MAADPTAGDLMKGTGRLRKLRFARASEGKSGGFRTTQHCAGEDVPIFLLDLLDEGEKANLSAAERDTPSPRRCRCWWRNTGTPDGGAQGKMDHDEARRKAVAKH